MHILKKYRELNDITQIELAEMVGVSKGMIGHIETGIRKVPHDGAWKWAKITGLKLEKLIPEVMGPFRTK